MLDAFGVLGTVTRPAPDNDPIADVSVIWLAPIAGEQPIGGEFQRQEPHRVVAIARSEVPTVPRGTLIVAPEAAGLPEKTWRVDGTVLVEHDHARVTVLEVTG